MSLKISISQVKKVFSNKLITNFFYIITYVQIHLTKVFYLDTKIFFANMYQSRDFFVFSYYKIVSISLECGKISYLHLIQNGFARFKL